MTPFIPTSIAYRLGMTNDPTPDHCPTCGAVRPARVDTRDLVVIRGKRYRAVETKRLTPTRHCGKGYTRAVPVVTVEEE